VTRPTSVMIATPMYGGMCTGMYVNSLLQTCQHLRDNGVEVTWAHLTNESLITRARNELARVFLELGFDYLMFIDADIAFPPDAVLHLLQTDRDVACALYPKKEVDWNSVGRAAQEGHTDLHNFAGSFVLNVVEGKEARADGQGMVEVRHGGTGFMMIKRQVFEKLIPHVPTYRTTSVRDEAGEYLKPLTHEFFATSIDGTGALLSEDFHFCELWRRHGGQVFANPFMQLSHVGTYVYSGNILRSGGNLK
jgi:hypothetical protein